MAAALLAVLGLVSDAVVGQPAPEWGTHRWVQGGPLSLASLRGRVVLVRFFMSADCPYCRGTAPSLNELHRELGPAGLVVVGMFTPKPRPRPTSVEEVRDYVEAYGFKFPVAVDDEWTALRPVAGPRPGRGVHLFVAAHRQARDRPPRPSRRHLHQGRTGPAGSSRLRGAPRGDQEAAGRALSGR